MFSLYPSDISFWCRSINLIFNILYKQVKFYPNQYSAICINGTTTISVINTSSHLWWRISEFLIENNSTIHWLPASLVKNSGSDGKGSACNAGYPGSVPGLGSSSEEGNGNPFQYCCLGKLHEQRSLVSYSLGGRKELDTTEQLTHIDWSFPGGIVVKNLPANAGDIRDTGLIPG